MKRLIATLGWVCLGMLVSGTGLVHGQCAGSIMAWGRHNFGQCDVPAPKVSVRTKPVEALTGAPYLADYCFGTPTTIRPHLLPPFAF